MARYLAMHSRHFGPNGLNVQMAIAAKRSLGVSAPFLGAVALSVGLLAYVKPEKALRTQMALESAIEGTLTFADYVKLVGPSRLVSLGLAVSCPLVSSLSDVTTSHRYYWSSGFGATRNPQLRVDNVREGIVLRSVWNRRLHVFRYIYSPAWDPGRPGWPRHAAQRGPRRPVNADPLTYQHTEVRK